MASVTRALLLCFRCFASEFPLFREFKPLNQLSDSVSSLGSTEGIAETRTKGAEFHFTQQQLQQRKPQWRHVLIVPY